MARARRADRRRFSPAPAGRDARAPPLAGDASFRRYVRLVDARRARGADGRAAAARGCAAVPRGGAASARPRAAARREILAERCRARLLLLEDFGDDTYTRLLAAARPRSALYALAVDVLIALHARFARAQAPALPPYDEARLLAEAALLVDWYAPAITGARAAPALRAEYLALWRALLPLARGVPHDAGAARLSCRQSDAARRARRHRRVRPARFPGRACWARRAYDLVSLLEDARRDVPPDARARDARALISRAFPALDRAAFARSYAVLGAQRNCKIIGIFTRLCLRDGKPQLSRAHSARLAAARARSAPSRAGAGRALARPPYARRHCARIPSRGAPHDRSSETAMVLAAGLGTRHAADHRPVPKPLVDGGRPARCSIMRIDRLAAVGVKRVVVNLHYKADDDRAASRRARATSRSCCRARTTLLETGGGVAKRAAACSATAFYVVNGDVLWLDGKHLRARAPGRRLRSGPASTRCCCCSARSARSAMTAAAISSSTPPARCAGAANARSRRIIFAGIQILHRRLFDGAPRRRLLAQPLWDRADRRPAGIAAIVHDGEWFHVGTPAGLAQTERAARQSRPRIERLSVAARSSPSRRTAVSRRAGRGARWRAPAAIRWRWRAMTVLLPTRRAARSAGRGVPARAATARALLLPRLLPVGDLDADELAIRR